MTVRDSWYLTINRNLVGTTYKSLTKQLLFARYIANDIIATMAVQAATQKRDFPTVEIRIMKNGVEQSKDVI